MAGIIGRDRSRGRLPPLDLCDSPPHREDHSGRLRLVAPPPEVRLRGCGAILARIMPTLSLVLSLSHTRILLRLDMDNYRPREMDVCRAVPRYLAFTRLRSISLFHVSLIPLLSVGLIIA